MNRVAHSMLCLALVGLVFGCSDTITAPSGSEDTALPASSSPAKKEVADITVSPSGDLSGVTDADAIENALNAAAPGDVIELGEGTFYINRTLVAPGFNGTLRGVGKDETTILGVGTESAPFGNTLINFPNGPFLLNGSSFFFFPQPSGSLTVSDLSTSLPGGFVTEVSVFFGGGTDLVSFFIVQLGEEDCNTLFDNVRLEGTEVSTPDPPPFLVHQPIFGIEVLGVGDAFPFFSSGGYHVVRNSEFSKVGFDTTIHQLLKDARIEITNNTFTDIKQIIARFLDGTDVSITGNTLDTILLGSLVVTQEGIDIPGERSNVLIRGNNINTRGFTLMPVMALSIPITTRL